MKALVTGSEGFIGKHLCAELAANGYEVVRCDLAEGDGIVSLDIMKPCNIKSVFETYRPDIVINMAGQANVGLSWKKPQETVELNTIGFVNILEAIRSLHAKIRVIAIGSSDEYGRLKDQAENVTEDISIRPMTPYAISKYAQELFAQLYVQSYGLDICMTRLFNLGGYGQAKGFMISDFAHGIAEIEAGKKSFMTVGNLESARDFTHVKDACRAIRLICEKGITGEVYNVCSGETHTAKEILNTLISMANVQIEVRQDIEKLRPSDTPIVRGNHNKLTAHTGWETELSINQILCDSLSYWRTNIGTCGM